MSAVILQHPAARRGIQPAQLPETLLRQVRIVARGNGCTALQIVDVETTAGYWLRQGMSHEEVMKRARARARLLSGNNGSAA